MSITRDHHLRKNAEPTQDATRSISVLATGMALSLFFAISFVLCVASYVLFPSWPVSHALALFLPGFSLLTWSTFFLGLAESAAWGWYISAVLVPLYNFFAKRGRA